MSMESDLQRAVRTRVATGILPAATVRVRTLLDVSEPQRRSGQLHRSQSVRPAMGPTTAQIQVEYTAPQAGFTNDGTRPHVIRPKRAKVLAFTVGGRRVFARVVHHPGNKPTKWFTKAVSPASWARILRDVTS